MNFFASIYMRAHLVSTFRSDTVAYSSTVIVYYIIPKVFDIPISLCCGIFQYMSPTLEYILPTIMENPRSFAPFL